MVKVGALFLPFCVCLQFKLSVYVNPLCDESDDVIQTRINTCGVDLRRCRGGLIPIRHYCSRRPCATWSVLGCRLAAGLIGFSTRRCSRACSLVAAAACSPAWLLQSLVVDTLQLDQVTTMALRHSLIQHGYNFHQAGFLRPYVCIIQGSVAICISNNTISRALSSRKELCSRKAFLLTSIFTILIDL